MKVKILHISDLHLNEFLGDHEYLRKGYYKEYINEFISTLGNEGSDIDFLIVTGDLIDMGKIENFPDIKLIIGYLADALKIGKEKVGFSIGNHDYKYKDDNGENSFELRKPFYDFAKDYANGNAVRSDDRFSLHKISEEIYFLAIDPTLDYQLKDKYPQLIEDIKTDKSKEIRTKPGNISVTECDSIVNTLEEYITNDKYLLVGCHYPIEKFPAGLLAQEEENFDNNHVWNQGASLRERINKIPSRATCWFFGDTHAPDGLIIKNVHYVMNGRFGTSTKKSSSIPRQAKLFSLNDDGASLLTLSTSSKTHADLPTDISWKSEKSPMRTISIVGEDNTPQVHSESKNLKENNESNKIDLINGEIEDEIIEKITNHNLYSFGRFKTSETNTSLGWVSINPLLNTGSILHSIIGKSVKRISYLRLDPASTILVGLEFWGAIIASQVSVSTSITNYCLATKGNGQFHSPSEISHEIMRDKLSGISDIVFFIDVVSCGETIHRVINNINALIDLGSLEQSLRFHVISIITDGKEYNPQYFKSINTFGTFCKRLKIPVINDSQLPDPNIIPYDLDLN